MKVKTDAKIDVRTARRAYVSLLQTAYKEFLARKADSAPATTTGDASPDPKKVKIAR
jgi:hypothetical protein